MPNTYKFTKAQWNLVLKRLRRRTTATANSMEHHEYPNHPCYVDPRDLPEGRDVYPGMPELIDDPAPTDPAVYNQPQASSSSSPARDRNVPPPKPKRAVTPIPREPIIPPPSTRPENTRVNRLLEEFIDDEATAYIATRGNLLSDIDESESPPETPGTPPMTPSPRRHTEDDDPPPTYDYVMMNRGAGAIPNRGQGAIPRQRPLPEPPIHETPRSSRRTAPSAATRTQRERETLSDEPMPGPSTSRSHARSTTSPSKAYENLPLVHEYTHAPGGPRNPIPQGSPPLEPPRQIPVPDYYRDYLYKESMAAYQLICHSAWYVQVSSTVIICANCATSDHSFCVANRDHSFRHAHRGAPMWRHLHLIARTYHHTDMHCGRCYGLLMHTKRAIDCYQCRLYVIQQYRSIDRLIYKVLCETVVPRDAL